MRSRNLKPSIFKNEHLAKLAPDCYRAFTGLWCLADRSGRLEDRPERIEAEIFPFKFQVVDIDAILGSLASCEVPFITRYAVDGKRFIQIINFERHQYPHVKEKTSTIPAPDSHGASTGLARLNPESGILNTESSTPYVRARTPARVNNGFDAVVMFEQVWAMYPVRVGKKAALRHYTAEVKNESDALLCKQALGHYLNSERVRRGYVQNGATWFNNWRDWASPPQERTGGTANGTAERVVGYAKNVPGKYSNVGQRIGNHTAPGGMGDTLGAGHAGAAPSGQGGIAG